MPQNPVRRAHHAAAILPPPADVRALLQTAAMLLDTGGKARVADAGKYLLRSLATWRTSARWANTLMADLRMFELARHEPHLLFRLQRPYLRAGLSREATLACLREHFDWLWRNWTIGHVRGWYHGRTTVLATLEGWARGAYDLRLGLAGARHCKEGELALALTSDGVPLVTAVFTVHRHDGAPVLDVGCLQGTAAGAEPIRRATRDMHGLRPKQAVLLALHAFARHFGIGTILGVPNDAHVYRTRARTCDRVSADYDAFWQEVGGVRVGSHFALASPAPRRPLEEVESRRRAQYRRRHALEDALRAGVAAGLPPASGWDSAVAGR